MEVEVKSEVKSQKSKVNSAATDQSAVADQKSSISEKNIPIWLDTAHPNFERWERARELSIERGKFVQLILSQFVNCENLNILDLGSGEGGTSKVFSEKNNVISFDLSLVRLKRQYNNISRINGDALNLPFKKNSFDLIILQDVIEHVSNPKQLIENLSFSLKENGIIYLSTPNKTSLFNIIADPHWGFPVISLLKRKPIKNYFLKYFRKNEMNRKDISQLFSLMELERLLKGNFKFRLCTNYSVEQLLKGNKGIVWSDFHLSLIKIIRALKLGFLLENISNDKKGIINRYFTPTFYLIIRKRN